MLYSKSTGGFYLREVHGDIIPDDAIEVSDDVYTELMAAQSAGKKISPDSDGNPVAIEQTITPEQLLYAKRKSVEYALQEAQNIAMNYFMKGDVFPDTWRKYVADLNAVQADLSFPLPSQPT